jgi:hypothetical protein
MISEVQKEPFRLAVIFAHADIMYNVLFAYLRAGFFFSTISFFLLFSQLILLCDSHHSSRPSKAYCKKFF